MCLTFKECLYLFYVFQASFEEPVQYSAKEIHQKNCFDHHFAFWKDQGLSFNTYLLAFGNCIMPVQSFSVLLLARRSKVRWKSVMSWIKSCEACVIEDVTIPHRMDEFEKSFGSTPLKYKPKFVLNLSFSVCYFLKIKITRGNSCLVNGKL